MKGKRRDPLAAGCSERRAERQPKLPERPPAPFEARCPLGPRSGGRHDHGPVRLIKDLMKDNKQVGARRSSPTRPVPGAWTRSSSAKIFNTTGPSTPVDAMMLSYRESVPHTGITEAGSAAAFQVVGVCHARPADGADLHLSTGMFGFQRTATVFWAAGDRLSAAFVIGATACRMTLCGRKAGRHSQVFAATNPQPVSYDLVGLRSATSCAGRPARMYGNAGDRDPNVMYHHRV